MWKAEGNKCGADEVDVYYSLNKFTKAINDGNVRGGKRTMLQHSIIHTLM